jgi:hypothetical protein
MPVCSDKSNSTGDTPDGAGYGRDVYTSRLEVGDFCNGRRATIIGTPGDDPIDGTVGNDVIAGLGGNDVVDGKGGTTSSAAVTATTPSCRATPRTAPTF